MNIKKISEIIEKLINYAAAVALAVIFALYLSGRVGWFILAAFLGAPVVSVLLTLLFVSRVYAECETDSVSLCKDEHCSLTVNITNGMFIPTPPVYVEIYDSPLIHCTEKLYTVSVLPFSTESFSVDCRAVISGPSEIGVKSIRISDYFGLFSFELKNNDYSRLKHTAAVIPDIADIPANDVSVTRAQELAAFADDSEDTTDSSSVTFGGFPGYDSRDYIPGDPLKRINWKQSVKRNRLLVRLDDETTCSSVSVVLDSSFDTKKLFVPAALSDERYTLCNAENIYAKISENAVEYSLGIVRMLVLRSYSVNYFLLGKNGWENYSVTDESDMSVLRTELASYHFSENTSISRFPRDELNELKGSVSVFCTPYYDETLQDVLASDSDSKGSLQTVIYSAASSPRAGSAKGAD